MSAAPLISFSGVSLYINERLFLDRIDLSVPEGETLVIAGPAGCGKSLVIRLVMGMPGLPRGESVAIDGTVQVDGVDLIGMSAVQLQLLRSQIGSVLRGGGLIDNMDVLQNITLPLNYHFRDVIGADAIAARCQLLLETLGQGHLDQPGRRPVSLNREEKVYVALARAFVVQPRMLLLDDLTTGLNPAAARAVVRSLALEPVFADGIDVHEGAAPRPVTRVITSSNLTYYLDIADRFAVLDRRRLRLVGGRQDVLESGDGCVRSLLHATDLAHG